MQWWMTALLALSSAAIVAAIARVALREAPDRPAPRRKPGAETAPAQPDDTPVTADASEIAVFRRLLKLEAQYEALEGRFADLRESTDRRFGRLNAARSRGTLPEAATGDEEDETQLNFLKPPAAPRAAPSRPSANGHRPLIPRR